MNSSSHRPSAVSTLSLIFLAISQLSQAHHCHQLDFGSCSNPSIEYGWDIDGSQRYGYLPSNDNDFPHGWSPDIATIESFICNRLESHCNAPPDTVQRCRETFNLYSGLSGDNAINTWNSALGITEWYDEEDKDEHCSSTELHRGYLTTTTTTFFVDQSIRPTTMLEVTTTTEISTTETTFTLTKTRSYTTKTYEIPSPSSTLTITLTLLSSTTSNQQPISTRSTETETQIQVTVQTKTTDTTTSLASETTGSDTSNSNSSPGPGGGSPFDSESAAPTLQALGNEGPLKLVFLLSLLALLIALWFR